MKTVAYIRTSNIYDDSRATKEIMALLENNYFVHIVGWNRDGRALEKTRETFSSFLDLVSLHFFDCEIKGGIGFSNVDKLYRWLRWMNSIVKSIVGLNVVHACNLDSCLGLLHFIRKNRIKLVYDIYDYYIDSHNIPLIISKLVENLEIKVINSSNLCIICTEERREQIAKAMPSKVVVIHNSPDISNIPITEEKYDYVYCGSLFDKRLLKEIFDDYRKNSDEKFIVAGYGDYSSVAQNLNDSYDNFLYLGAISYSEVLKIEAQSKVISAIYEPSIRNHRLCAPNKFYEALALGKPVIVCKGTGIDHIVEHNNIGCVIDYSSEQFYDSLRFLSENDGIRKEMGNRARQLYVSEFNWIKMKEILINEYELLIVSGNDERKYE